MATKSIGRIILIIVLGCMIGTLFGKLIGLVLPGGVVKDFFLKEANFEIGPSLFDVGLLALTLGFKLTLNIVGLLGVAVAIYMLRWY
jgi:hypothetical protein